MSDAAPDSVGSSRIEGAVLAVVALACLAFQLWLPSTHVAESDYQAVGQVLAAEGQPGDVVLLVPWWTERARIFVPESIPVVGYQGSDGDALEAHPRIWVLSQPHQPRSGIGAFEDLFLPKRTPVGTQRSFGNLRLQLYANGRYRQQTLVAADMLDRAQVYLETADGSRQPCSPMGNGFRCPNGQVVAKEWHEVHFAPYSCVKLEAPAQGQRVMVELTSPATESSTLLAGYIWEYGAYRDGVTPSTVWLEVNGQPQTLELPTHNELMHRLDGPAIPEGARVRFGLSAANPRARVVCVVLTGTKGAP